MRVELEPRGVHVSVVHPIGTRTEFFDKLHERARGGGGTARIVDHTPGMLMQSAEFVADRTVACLRRPRAEVWTGFMGAAVRTGMSIGNMFPRLTDRALRGMVRRRMFPHQTAAALDATPQTAR
jgi:short-subunit dehydrogenase